VKIGRRLSCRMECLRSWMNRDIAVWYEASASSAGTTLKGRTTRLQRYTRNRDARRARHRRVARPLPRPV
jgi:hypothetical protein